MPRTVALFALLLLTSCATFESGELPGLDRWPVTATSGEVDPSGLQFVPRWLHFGTSGLPRKFEASWERGLRRELEASGRFSGVELIRPETSPYAPPDRYVSFDFEHSRSNLWLTRIWMGVCAMTATVIPARTVQYFDVIATVRDRDGHVLGTIERSVSGSTWVGLLPLLALPFAGGGLGELVRDTSRSIIVEGAENGWL